MFYVCVNPKFYDRCTCSTLASNLFLGSPRPSLSQDNQRIFIYDVQEADGSRTLQPGNNHNNKKNVESVASEHLAVAVRHCAAQAAAEGPRRKKV